jgi:hypothetical protein
MIVGMMSALYQSGRGLSMRLSFPHVKFAGLHGLPQITGAMLLFQFAQRWPWQCARRLLDLGQ